MEEAASGVKLNAKYRLRGGLFDPMSQAPGPKTSLAVLKTKQRISGPPKFRTPADPCDIVSVWAPSMTLNGVKDSGPVVIKFVEVNANETACTGPKVGVYEKS